MGTVDQSTLQSSMQIAVQCRLYCHCKGQPYMCYYLKQPTSKGMGDQHRVTVALVVKECCACPLHQHLVPYILEIAPAAQSAQPGSHGRDGEGGLRKSENKHVVTEYGSFSGSTGNCRHVTGSEATGIAGLVAGRTGAAAQVPKCCASGSCCSPTVVMFVVLSVTVSQLAIGQQRINCVHCGLLLSLELCPNAIFHLKAKSCLEPKQLVSVGLATLTRVSKPCPQHFPLVSLIG